MELKKIISLAGRVKRDLSSIQTKKVGVVMFVDLVGSTAYKSSHPAEADWLPRLATFLLSVTRIVEEHGRVVKYIGDEVMAFYDSDSAILFATQAAERILEFCKKYKEHAFEVKIAMDYGAVSMLHFDSVRVRRKNGQGDPNGIVVDRCARIMSKASAGVVLCSDGYHRGSGGDRRWSAVGTFSAKGLLKKVKVYQLLYPGATRIRVRDEKMSLENCLEKLTIVESQLRETKALRRPARHRAR